MLLITTFVELHVVAGRSRTRAGSPQAVCRRTCCAVALRRIAWPEHGMASVNQTQPHCVNQMGKTQSKPLAAWHGRGNGMGAACYAWIGRMWSFLWPYLVFTYRCGHWQLLTCKPQFQDYPLRTVAILLQPAQPTPIHVNVFLIHFCGKWQTHMLLSPLWTSECHYYVVVVQLSGQAKCQYIIYTHYIRHIPWAVLEQHYIFLQISHNPVCYIFS